MEEIRIGSKKIGGSNPVYIIAEIGLNHQGDVTLARELVDVAVRAGADCVKFQKRSLTKLYRQEVLTSSEKEEQGTHYTLSHILKTELSEKNMEALCNYAKKRRVDFICTPWDQESLEFLSKLDVPAYKVASADMFNFGFIRSIARFQKPMIISTGMSYMSEIEQLVDFLKSLNAQFILLHCNSTYPAPYNDLNLNTIKTLAERTGGIVGYSGHEPGISVALAAVALGAKVIEKHVTLDRNMPGPDHRASLEPDEFGSLVREIRIVEESLGEKVRFPSRGEYLNRETLSKSLVASRNIKIGDVLSYSDIDVKSPGKGTNPIRLESFIGKKVIKRNIKRDDYILDSDIGFNISKEVIIPKIHHKWGIVVRMSDIDDLIALDPDFVEVHLTDTDVNLNIEYRKHYDLDLCVHGPEYNDDLLLDLSSLNDDVRNRSIDFYNRAMDHARSLKKLFKNKNKSVKFVIHPGGMNVESALLDKIPELNNRLHDSLGRLNGEGLELLVENMPGMAWYFGGQWYQSSFMDADEIVKFSKRNNIGIIFDTSHASLYCNLYGKNLEEFTRRILTVARYVHISDGAKYNGEGLQIGDGNIDFKKIMPHLSKTNLWFLPEIWQGHKFGGHGFAQAILKLKQIDSDF